MSSEKRRYRLFSIRTTSGQELNVALIAENRVRSQNLKVASIIALEEMRGFVLVETVSPREVERAFSGIKHVKGRVYGLIDFKDIEGMIKPRPTIELLNLGDVVEVTSGPLRGMKARVTSIDKVRQEVTLELLEITYSLPVKIRAEFVKPVKEGA